MSKIKTRQALIKAYIEHFKKKKHKHIPSASLIPENDPTALFISAGMQPLVPFFSDRKHPMGDRIVNVQKCIRTVDIDEVGDTSHLTFFEMLGNWGLGSYWKPEALKMTFDFHTKILGIPLEKYAISCFKGNKVAPKDLESSKIWQALGVPKERIAFLEKDNWWELTSETSPGGPSTEMFYYTGEKAPKKFDPKDSNWIEIGNDVLIEYQKTPKGYQKAEKKNIDFGGGLERTLALLNGLEDIYLSEIFTPIIKEIEKISRKEYGKDKEETRAMRIIADHVKAAVLILGDEKSIAPSNLGQGYVLRRLIRRAIRYGKILGIQKSFIIKIAKSVLPIYPDYQELKRNEKFIFSSLNEEEFRFSKTLERGLNEFTKLATDKIITGKEAFLLFQSYGFPIEMTEELANEKGIKIDLEEYNKEFQNHQDLSRTLSSKQFRSGLADNSEKTKKLHTATHLLNEALRIILKDPEIKQKGSNINSERLRFDFNFQRKLTQEELKAIQNLVNQKISQALKIEKEEILLNDALESEAQAEFGAQYPDLVFVYTILDKKDPRGFFSKEICTGPHVENTKEIGTFKILKEESSSAGIRRIKATIE